MTAITLESDSSHSPPVLINSNERSSRKGLKSRGICGRVADFCENSRRRWRTIPRSFVSDPLEKKHKEVARTTRFEG